MTDGNCEVLLAALRAALLSVHFPKSHLEKLNHVDSLLEAVIDLEWEEDHAENLLTVGIGWTNSVVQFRWPELSEYERTGVRCAVDRLTRRAHVVLQNAIGDFKVMRQHGFDVSPAACVRLDDVMLMHAALFSEEDHDLGYIGERFGRLPKGYKALKTYAPDEYNAGDLVETAYVYLGLAGEFRKYPAEESIYREQSLAYLREIQLEAEEYGIKVNQQTPSVLYDAYGKVCDDARRLAKSYVGGVPFKLSSPDDLKTWLYGIEGFPAQSGKAKDGEKITSDKDALAALRRLCGTEWDPDEAPTLEQAVDNIAVGGHPLLEARYLFFGAQQARSHYVAACLSLSSDKRQILAVRDRIYPETRLHVQASGRPSIVDPALQQFKGQLLGLIEPDPGYFWGGHDWKQIEVRILAWLADDKPYLEAFAAGTDIHELNRLMLFGPQGSPELTEMQRRFTKAFAFRLHYRGNPKRATDIPGVRFLGLNPKKLVEASEAYLGGHPAIPKYWEWLDDVILSEGCVYTFMGRARRLTSPYPAARIREGSNHGMQGGVADWYITTALLVKRAMPWVRLMFGAHDSQTWQVPVGRRDEFWATYKPIVERPCEIKPGVWTSFPADWKERQCSE